MKDSPDHSLALRLDRFLRERAQGDPYLVINSGQACAALDCSPQELADAFSLLTEHGAVLHIELLPFDTDGSFHLRN